MRSLAHPYPLDMRHHSTVDQPDPERKDDGVDVAALVHDDIEARVDKGADEYGERLRTHNGRNALVDAYQEALDLCLYLRQEIEERQIEIP